MSLGLRERNRIAAMDGARRVAFALMSDRGFDSVTVEEIASAAGVSPSTIYRYFGTKESLVLSSTRIDRLIERLAKDSSDRSWSEAFQRAAVKAWTSDETAHVEIGLILANESLLHAWERQLLDLRPHVAELFALRRGKSLGTKDEVRAAVAVAVLASTLARWHAADGDKQELTRLLRKALQAIRTD